MEQRRNDPCRCGSGKKYKHCCTTAAGPESNLLGQAAELVRCGDFPAAIAIFVGIAQAAQDSAKAHYQLAVALKELGLAAESAACYQQALLQRPDYVEALNNLGVIFEEQKEFAKAAALFQKALHLRPEAAMGHYNLGVVLVELNRPEEARLCFSQALVLQSGYVEAHYNLGLLAREEGAWASAAAHLRRAVELRPDYPRAQAELAILTWMNGDFAECSFCLEQLTHSRSKLSGDEQRFVPPYRKFLGKLLAYRRDHGDLFPGSVNLPVLYAVGDSHCLAPAHLQVVRQDITYRVEARIVVGAKAWHLGRNQPNRYQQALEKIVAAIPPGAQVLLLFGEIDCRLDEGIILHHQQTGNDLTQAIPELVEHYVAYLANLCGARSIRPMIANVPEPSRQNDTVLDEKWQQQAMVIREFNRALESSCSARNYPILDVYGASTQPEGLAQEGRLDGCHLEPGLYKQLLDEL